MILAIVITDWQNVVLINILVTENKTVISEISSPQPVGLLISGRSVWTMYLGNL